LGRIKVFLRKIQKDRTGKTCKSLKSGVGSTEVWEFKGRVKELEKVCFLDNFEMSEGLQTSLFGIFFSDENIFLPPRKLWWEKCNVSK